MRVILLGVLALLLAGTAVAVPVDPNAPDGVVARIFYGGNALFVGSDGRVFVINSQALTGSWEDWTPSWPVPFQDIADIEFYFITTHDGTVWGNNGNYQGGINWVQIPPSPISPPVPSDSESLGGVKGMFR